MAIQNMIFTEITEQGMKEIIKNRTKAQWRALYIRRLFLITFNILFLAGCATGIIISSIKKTEIVNWAEAQVKKYSWLPPEVASFAELAPQIILGVSNGLVNPVSRKITILEKYDFFNDTLNQQIWRIWFGKIINFLIFVVVQVQLASQFEILIP